MHELVSQSPIENLKKPPTEEEAKEIAGIPFSTLVEQAYNELNKTLDKGLTPQLMEVLKEQSRRLLVFWQIQQEKYDKALAEGLVEEEDSWLVEGDTKSDNTYDSENQIAATHLETPREIDVILWSSPIQGGPNIYCGIKKSPKSKRTVINYTVFYEGSLIKRVLKREKVTDLTSEEDFYVSRKSEIDLLEFFRGSLRRLV